MQIKPFEKTIISTAATTLAGMKVANLFSYAFSSLEECLAALTHYNAILNSKGVFLELLNHRENFYQIYIYRPAMLQKTLADVRCLCFLNVYGYNKNMNVHEAIETLKSRVSTGSDFPHEIGIFLGYPIEDVCGFIANKGQNYLCTGPWKVYSNKEHTQKIFRKYSYCFSVYTKVYNNGMNLKDITVAITA